MIISSFQIEVFKQHNEFPPRRCHKVKTTVLIVFVVVRVSFSSNVLLCVSHIQSNVTSSSI